jgi:hypothetical protein
MPRAEELSLIGTTYSARMIELVYRQLRKSLCHDRDCDGEVKDIMDTVDTAAGGETGQIELERLNTDVKTITLFNRIKDSYNKWKAAECNHFMRHVTCCLNNTKVCPLLPGLQTSVDDAIMEAEKLLDTRMPNRKYFPYTS